MDAPKPYSLNRHPIPSRRMYEYDQMNDFDWQQRKKRKLRSYAEDSGTNWSEHEKFVLLEVWGDRFLQLGRNSLRNEDWADVAEKVTEALKSEMTETQCRQIMNDLKRRYKREKSKMEKLGFSSCSKWAFFKKMDMLMLRQEECGLSCGVDSGEFVFMDTAVYLERSNGFDEMRDSPCESEVEEDDDGDEEEERERDSMRVLADSVERFGEIYEKIEISKRENMRELEKMRAEFCKELEVQKKLILDRTQVEIAKIRDGDDSSEDDSDDDDDDNDDDEDDDGVENENDNDNVSE